jgi:hypothetical protein
MISTVNSVLCTQCMFIFYRYASRLGAFLASKKFLSILMPSNGTNRIITVHCVIFLIELGFRQAIGPEFSWFPFDQEFPSGSEVKGVRRESTLLLFHHGGCFISPGCQLGPRNRLKIIVAKGKLDEFVEKNFLRLKYVTRSTIRLREPCMINILHSLYHILCCHMQYLSERII